MEKTEYINREAFRRKLIDEKAVYPACVDRALDEMPVADVVEVVRCRDCAHFRKGKCFHPKQESGWDSMGGEHLSVEQTDFCSYGERKEDGVCKKNKPE